MCWTCRHARPACLPVCQAEERRRQKEELARQQKEEEDAKAAEEEDEKAAQRAREEAKARKLAQLEAAEKAGEEEAEKEVGCRALCVRVRACSCVAVLTSRYRVLLASTRRWHCRLFVGCERTMTHNVSETT